MYIVHPPAEEGALLEAQLIVQWISHVTVYDVHPSALTKPISWGEYSWRLRNASHVTNLKLAPPVAGWAWCHFRPIDHTECQVAANTSHPVQAVMNYMNWVCQDTSEMFSGMKQCMWCQYEPHCMILLKFWLLTIIRCYLNLILYWNSSVRCIRLSNTSNDRSHGLCCQAWHLSTNWLIDWFIKSNMKS